MDGKVALITGAARGQGQSHAVRLAEEGANILALDQADLDETVALVEATGRQIFGRQADVRQLNDMKTATDDGISELGRIDTIVANAAIARFGPPLWETEKKTWQDLIDVNLAGVYHTVSAAVPAMIEQGSGSVIMVSSGSGLAGFPGGAAYAATKHGVIGLMRSLAMELAQHSIRVNAICPGLVNTPMVHDPAFLSFAFPGNPNATADDLARHGTSVQALPIPWLEPIDISNAVLWLASDEARYVTGVTLPVDGGWFEKRNHPHDQ